MKTFKLKHRGIDITELCENYSYMFRNLYSNFELSEDKIFQKELQQKFNLDSWFFQSCLVDAKTKIEQNETQKKNNSNKIDELKNIIECNDFVGSKGRRTKFKILNKLNYLTSNANKEIAFGTKVLLRRISYLPNLINKLKKSLLTEISSESKSKIQSEIEKTEKELIECKLKYKQNRIFPILSIGEAPQNSNRKFNFDFENKKIQLKPEKGIVIAIEYYCSKNQHAQLVKLQSQIGLQAITVRLDNDYIYITFDNEKLNGYAFNKNEHRKELKNIPKGNAIERKECSKKWFKEQEARKLVGKNINRYFSVDLNPEYIGFVVLEKSGEKFKTLYKECISLVGLNTRLGLSSANTKQVYQNNKRIHEIHECWKRIFKIAARFRASHCVIEDLEFKQKGVNENSNEANRITKSFWHRTLTSEVIKKHCDELGIKLIKVNAAYSSFIGNIQHKFFDPISAEIEIGRRGINKYLKGGFYPKLERIDLDTMYSLGLDVQGKTISTWVQAYKLFKISGLRYRWKNNFSSENNILSPKSCMITYNFI